MKYSDAKEIFQIFGGVISICRCAEQPHSMYMNLNLEMPKHNKWKILLNYNQIKVVYFVQKN